MIITTCFQYKAKLLVSSIQINLIVSFVNFWFVTFAVFWYYAIWLLLSSILLFTSKHFCWPLVYFDIMRNNRLTDTLIRLEIWQKHVIMSFPLLIKDGNNNLFSQIYLHNTNAYFEDLTGKHFHNLVNKLHFLHTDLPTLHKQEFFTTTILPLSIHL